MSELKKASAFWDEQHYSAQRHAEGWMAFDEVRQYINDAVSRSCPSLWPLDWLAATLADRHFKRGLSIGCGTGSLERFVASRGLCARVDAFDGSLQSLHTATRLAREEGVAEKIRYFSADFNRIKLPPNAYDIVFFNQSMHHVSRLEGLLSEVLSTLTPDGILFLDEYVGPSRHEWDSTKLIAQQTLFYALPREWRKHEFLWAPIELDDPSEAVRSSEITRSVEVGFEVLHRRDYGGGVLSIVVPMIDWSRAPRDLITTLIAADNGFLQSEGGTYYTVIIAAPKKRERRRRALLRYFLEPKFRYGLTVRFRRLRAWLSGVAREMPLSRVRGNRSEGPRP